MNSWGILLIEMSVGMILSYLFYYFFLRKLTWFNISRFYLLFSVLISIAIPFLNFSLAINPVDTTILWNMLDTVTITAGKVEQSLLSALTAWQWLGIVYLLGVLVFLSLFIIRTISLAKVLIRTHRSPLKNGVYSISENIAPFSFFNKIYINTSMYNAAELEEVIQHEQAHIKQWHTLDCLFFELITILFWFNPFVFRFRNAAKEIHEYLADNRVVKNGNESVSYQKLLFNQAAGLRMLSIPNSFNYSLTKKRITMLTKIKSSKKTLLRLTLFVPVILALGIVFACEKADNAQKTNTDNMDIEIKEVSPEETAKMGVIGIDSVKTKEEACYRIVETMPEFPGGDHGFRTYIAKSVVYPKAAVQDGIQGKVFIEFIVDKEGKVGDVKVVRSVNPLLDAEAVRVVSNSPEWTPGKEKGEAVNVYFTIPIDFKLQ